MDWLSGMNRAMEYIEKNLCEEISYDEIARLANCSVYHLQRMFPYITGVALSEYIRRRRLTLAAGELLTTDIKIIDLAMKYGYDSPEAFSRAFKKLHGVAPIAARSIGATLKAYPPMSFHISIKGDTEMNYRIEQRKSFQVFGKYTRISTDHSEAFMQVPQFFKQCDDDGTTDGIISL
jgi:AraC family transcriptional regulator